MTTRPHLAAPDSAPRAAPRPRTLAVASGKGGVGKTFLAASLAHALARRGERVLLVDGDFGLANIDVQLGLAPQRDLADLLAGSAQADQAILGVERDSSGGAFDVLPGRSGSGALGGLPIAELGRLCEMLITLGGPYDRMLLDAAAGIDPSVTLLCSLADLVLVVLTEDPTSLTDAYALVKVLARAERRPAMGVVVNMATDASQGRRIHKALAQATQRFLGFEPPLLGVLRRDAHVGRAIRAQAPLLARFPQSPAASDVAALATRFG
ncbi:MAG: P-loop NTPase [Alphaproteobacteria bacterium]|nr:P-loop NTPase [Alphaproteobacteria bacterium]